MRAESARLLELAKVQGRVAENQQLPANKELGAKTAAYREEWQKYEAQVLSGLQDVFGLEFYDPVIDVHIAPYFNPHSHPLIVNTRYEPDQFVDELTHEMIHVLITDNTTYQYGPKLRNLWNKLYEVESTHARNHILVQAGSKYIYLDVLEEPRRLERDKEKSLRVKTNKGWEGYHEAWKYVEEHGYMEIIEEFKAHYDELKE